MTEESKFDEEIDENKNKNNIHCQFCNSLILKKYSGNFTKQEFSLPLMHQKNKQTITEIELELLKHYWSVDDMFKFENIGFSHTVKNIKYLVCADCEMGPVGYHDTETKKCFVSLKRVKHTI